MPVSDGNPASLLPNVVDAGSEPGGLSFSIARVLLLLTLMGAPLAFGAVQDWAWAALAVLAVLPLFLWAVGSVRQGVLTVVWSPIYLFAALFVLLGVIQFAAHVTLDPFATRQSLLMLLTYLIFFFVSIHLLPGGSGKTLRTFGLATSVYAFAMALFAILQFFSSQGLIYWTVRVVGVPFGSYVNRNHYAGLMEMLIPIAFAYSLVGSRDKAGRPLLGYLVVVPVASLLLSGSRGGFVSLLVEVAIFAAVLFYGARTSTRRSLGMVGALGITVAALLFFWLDPGQISKSLATIAHVGDAPDTIYHYREAVARDSLHMLNDHPWLGVGLGSYKTAYLGYRSFPSDLAWEHAHDDYLEALSETGLVGGAVIAAALVMFLSLAFGNLPERLRHRSAWIQLGAAVGCCGLLAHSFVDFNLHIPANAAWFAVCAGCAMGCVDKSKPLGSRAESQG